MKIQPLGSSFYSYPKSKSNCYVNNALKSVPQSKGADIFCFKGSCKDDTMEIIPASNPGDLEKNIESELGKTPVETEVKKFKNGEIYVNIEGNVRGKDVFIMPASGENVNDNLMETYIKADAAKRSGANKVIAVLPNFDYARQERRVKQGEAISAKLNMDLLKTAGVDEIITTDLHTAALEGFASNSLRITPLKSEELMKNYINKKGISNLIVVSPDLGGTKRADEFAKSLGCDKAIIYKHRQAHNQATAEDLIGNVEGKNCVIYDDIIDTAGTIAEASKLLKKKGAADIYVCAAHGLFNGEAMQRLEEAPVKEVIVTNSVPAKSNSIDKIKQIDISIQIADAMRKIAE